MSETAAPPVIILCVGRSGSTLLSRVLDAHPHLACPHEIDLGKPIHEIDKHTAIAFSNDPDLGIQTSNRLASAFADSTYGFYARQVDKSRWACKALSSVIHAELLLRVFPEAQFICLYRNCPDTIASLFESSNTGYNQFGLEPYALDFIRNIYHGLGVFWADRVEKIIDFEAKRPAQCHRVLYETLVLEPQSTTRSLMKFLNLEWQEDFFSPEKVFTSERRADFHGDYKINYKRTYDPSSIGRGRSVPLERIGTEVRARIDALSAQIGYPELGDFTHVFDTSAPKRNHFGSVRRKKEPRSLTRTGNEGGDPVPDLSNLPRDVSELFETRIAGNLAEGGNNGVTPGHPDYLSFVLLDHPLVWQVDWRDRSVNRVTRPSNVAIITDCETLLAVANKTYHIATAVRDSKLRLSVEPFAEVSPFVESQVFYRHIDALMELLDIA